MIPARAGVAFVACVLADLVAPRRDPTTLLQLFHRDVAMD